MEEKNPSSPESAKEQEPEEGVGCVTFLIYLFSFVMLCIFIFTGFAKKQVLLINKGRAEYQPRGQVRQGFFVGGAGQQEETKIAPVCGGASRIARLETHTSFSDSLLSLVTLGIYSPQTLKIYCLATP